jgi:hypothetical protein
MQVLCTIVALEPSYDQQSKVKAKLKMLFDQPFDATEINLFEHHAKQGFINRCQALVGQKVLMPLQAELYNGKVQYALPYGCLPEAYHSPGPANVDRETGEVNPIRQRPAVNPASTAQAATK